VNVLLLDMFWGPVFAIVIGLPVALVTLLIAMLVVRQERKAGR